MALMDSKKATKPVLVTELSVTTCREAWEAARCQEPSRTSET